MAGTETGGAIIGQPWYQTIGHTLVSTTSTATTIDPWICWNESITSATTTTIWTNWILPAGTSYRGRLVEALPQARLVREARARFETPEQQAARLAAQEAAQCEGREIARQMQAERAQAQIVKDAARDKARALLLQHLDERQRIDLASNGYFDLETIQPSGERRRYRIHRGRAGNVRRLDERGREVKRYCIHPIIACPDEDTMLTQKLWLETQEEVFLRTANAS